MSAVSTRPTTKKRPICHRCQRPTPRACVCASLPPKPVKLRRCRVVVLQHPNERRLKNRSLPLIELCLGAAGAGCSDCSRGRHTPRERSDGEKEDDAGCLREDWSMKVVVGRRLGDKVDPGIMALLNEPIHAVLVYPFGDNVMSLQEALEEIGQRRRKVSTTHQHQPLQESSACSAKSEKARCSLVSQKEPMMKLASEDQSVVRNDSTAPRERSVVCNGEVESDINEKITFVFIDATWKYAREMERTNTKLGLWTRDMIRVRLCPPAENLEHRTKSAECEGGNFHASRTRTNDDATTVADDVGSIQRPRHLVSGTVSPCTNNNGSQTEGHGQVPSPQSMADVPRGYKPRRFDIRTPPTENHLSTGECIAWVAAFVEQNPLLYETLMKPLDMMVAQWHSFSNDRGQEGGAGMSRA